MDDVRYLILFETNSELYELSYDILFGYFRCHVIICYVVHVMFDLIFVHLNALCIYLFKLINVHTG
jgi:hypothetical protein